MEKISIVEYYSSNSFSDKKVLSKNISTIYKKG